MRKLAVALVLALVAFAAAHAQSYPNKTVKIVVPSIPGSPTDAVARIFALQLQTRLGQTVIVENRPGAGQTIGTKAAAAAAPDGYTLLFSGDALAYFPVSYPNFAFDPLNSLTPIASTVTWSNVMVVSPSVPANTVAELVAYAKANPGKLIAGMRIGTTPHIVAHAFRQATGTDITFVPYAGGEQARTDLLGGRVHINFGPPASLRALIEDGRARALAYTGPTRTPVLPDVPTMIESGYPQVGFNPDGWYGLFGPAGLPTDVLERINSEVNASLNSPELKALLAKLGFDPKVTTPREFAAFVAAEIQKWPPLLKAAGLKGE